MNEEPLTFSELRKIEKEEKRKSELTDLSQNFLIKASKYFSTKKQSKTDKREINNAKRVFNKIISLREDKIVKNAKIAVKTGNSNKNSNFLPREKELFRKLRKTFSNHRGNIDDIVQKPEDENTTEKTDNSTKKQEKKDENNKEEKKETEKTYTPIKITSKVPEFMGTDLETYGPFKKGEEAKLPEENAEILINRGNAKKLEKEL